MPWYEGWISSNSVKLTLSLSSITISSQWSALESAPVSTFASKSKSSKSIIEIVSLLPTIFLLLIFYPYTIENVKSQGNKSGDL